MKQLLAYLARVTVDESSTKTTVMTTIIMIRSFRGLGLPVNATKYMIKRLLEPLVVTSRQAIQYSAPSAVTS